MSRLLFAIVLFAFFLENPAGADENKVPPLFDWKQASTPDFRGIIPQLDKSLGKPQVMRRTEPADSRGLFRQEFRGYDNATVHANALNIRHIRTVRTGRGDDLQWVNMAPTISMEFLFRTGTKFVDAENMILAAIGFSDASERQRLIRKSIVNPEILPATQDATEPSSVLFDPSKSLGELLGKTESLTPLKQGKDAADSALLGQLRFARDSTKYLETSLKIPHGQVTLRLSKQNGFDRTPDSLAMRCTITYVRPEGDGSSSQRDK